MLPLAGTTLPESPEQLRQALLDGLTAHGLPPRVVEVQGNAWPALERLRLDFTGVAVGRTLRLPLGQENSSPGVEVTHFELTAQPLLVEGTPFQLALHAAHAQFVFASAGPDQTLAITAAQSGDLSLEVTRTALESLIQSFAAAAAGKQGVDIKQTRLTLTSLHPRALAFRAEITAKMFVVTTTLTLSGEITVDDQLEARFSQLRFAGDGMIAKVASGYIRPQLEKLEGRRFPLLAFSLGSIQLRDLQLTAGDSLRLTAQFGSPTG